MTAPPVPPVFPLHEYEVGALIGEGQFGEVRSAWSRKLDAEVALKRIPHRASDSVNKIRAEQRGAELQRRLAGRHRNLVPEVFEDGIDAAGDYYIAMERIAGRPLADVIREGRRDSREAARLGLAIADFLGTLHALSERDNGEEPIVHSDLKPDHVLVLPDDTIRVLDLGIAKTLQANRALTVNFWASAPYASPERLEDGNVRLGDDLWALGIMLFELVSGEHPYHAYMVDDNNAALARAIRRGEPPAPVHGGCDAELAAIIRKLLAPQPARRYDTAQEVAEDLRRYLAGQQPVAAGESIRASTPTQVVPVATTAVPRHDTVPTEPLPAAQDDGRRAQESLAPDPPQGVWRRRIRPRLKLSRLAWRPPALARRARPFVALIAIAIFLAEVSSCIRAERLRERLGAIEAADVEQIRTSLRRVEGGAPLGVGLGRLHQAVTERMLLMADRPIHDFRQDLFVSQLQWEQAQRCLTLAAEHAGSDARVTARAALVDAHLTRIAAQSKGLAPRERQRRLTAAMSRFIEAARLDPGSPDPYLGQARINAYEFHDYDALVGNIAEAERRGYRAGRRERMQLGDTLRYRADRAMEQALRASADGRARWLQGAADDYQACIDRFEGLGTYHDAERVLAHCQLRRATASRLLQELSAPADSGDLDESSGR